MSQSKRHSALETATNTAVGFVGSYFITFSCFHLNADLATKTLYATLGCTVWSLLRGYYLRRLFNHLHAKATREPWAGLDDLESKARDPDPADSATKRPSEELMRQVPDDLPCDHVFVDGFGAMGDALTCCECGWSKYPEALPADMLKIARRRHRVIETSHPQYRLYVEKVQALQRAQPQ